jgi:aminoglycoside phosphotransferase (APT) family kinase protein
LEFDRLLDKLASQPIEQGGLTRQQAATLERVLPAYEGRCAELAASPIPDSFQHDDLHSNNVGWPGEMADLSSVRIIDWGDASIGHPFGTMLATLNSIAFEAGVPVDGRQFHDSRLLRLRDAYLEPFGSLCGVEELRWLVGLARSTGCVTRALAWERALQEAPLSMIARYEFPVRSWLLELLEPWADEVRLHRDGPSTGSGRMRRARGQ